jgi:hypothetical protein
MKKVLSLLLVASSILPMQLDLINVDNKASELSHYLVSKINNKIHIKSPSVFVPDKLGSVELYHNKKGFYVKQDNEKHLIKKYFTDPIVRDITKKQLNAFLKNGYLSLNQMNDGEFSLKASGRLNGGGAVGAVIGAFLGKAAVSVVGHGAIQIVALCTGPAYFPTMVALESCFGYAIEAASIKGAIGGGILLGAATGPV